MLAFIQYIIIEQLTYASHWQTIRGVSKHLPLSSRCSKDSTFMHEHINRDVVRKLRERERENICQSLCRRAGRQASKLQKLPQLESREGQEDSRESFQNMAGVQASEAL